MSTYHPHMLQTCTETMLVPGALGTAIQSGRFMLLSLLARRKGWGWGMASVRALSRLWGAYLGDSTKGTERRRTRVSRLCFSLFDLLVLQTLSKYVTMLIHSIWSTAQTCVIVLFYYFKKKTSSRSVFKFQTDYSPTSVSRWFLIISPSSKWPDITATW